MAYATTLTKGPISTASPFARIGKAFRVWNDTRQTRRALSALNDDMLEDIGLTRSDLTDPSRLRRLF